MLSANSITVSVVVPTRNRPAELQRLLASLELQDHPLTEVIVVDSGDSPLDKNFFKSFPHLTVHHYISSPSVCAQRNLGIRHAASEFIFLCDDDMEVPADYVAALAGFFETHPSESVVSGLIAEPGPDGKFRDSPPLTARRLVWNYLFMLGAWGDLREIRTSRINGWIVDRVKRAIRRKGNTQTKAGWPIVTWMGEPEFTTKFYGLGASLVRRKLLLEFPFDETLDVSGIGDHYGFALNVSRTSRITVFASNRCHHHHTAQQRMQSSTIYSLRILALDHFQQGIDGYKVARRFALLWSLVGNLIPFVIRGKWAYVTATLRVVMIILAGRNSSSGGVGRAGT